MTDEREGNQSPAEVEGKTRVTEPAPDEAAQLPEADMELVSRITKSWDEEVREDPPP